MLLYNLKKKISIKIKLFEIISLLFHPWFVIDKISLVQFPAKIQMTLQD